MNIEFCKRSTPDVQHCAECFGSCGGPSDTKVFYCEDDEDAVFCSVQCGINYRDEPDELEKLSNQLARNHREMLNRSPHPKC